MMTDPVCSVVIPTWNGRDLVERCLTAMLQIVDPEHVEIIVVDDGSADHTFEHIRHVFPQVIRCGMSVTKATAPHATPVWGAAVQTS
jgi:GT2 family glycosyltransferase